jgi:ferritin-like metal-binding protein YciE
MQVNTLEDVLVLQLQDLYSAEGQIIEALPKMIEAASSDELREAFEDHLQQTEEQYRRLEEIGEELDIEVSGEPCRGMEGLIEEGQQLIDENEPGPALDAALIAAAQRIEHYEIAAYGSAVAYAKQLDDGEVARILQQTLDEEGATDKKLTKLAEATINPGAA